MSDEFKTVFDAARPIEVKLLSSDGAPKKVRLRFPTDAEWTERQRRRRLFIKHLGRGKTVTETPDSSDADLALFRRILESPDAAPEVDGYEASRVIEELERADVDEIEHEAGGFRILLRVPGGVTLHLLRKPTAREIFQHGRAFSSVVGLPRGRQELSINLEAAAVLYSKLCQNTQGYHGLVPIIHQAVIVSAAIEETRASLEDEGADGGEDFFGPTAPPGPSAPDSAS